MISAKLFKRAANLASNKRLHSREANAIIRALPFIPHKPPAEDIVILMTLVNEPIGVYYVHWMYENWQMERAIKRLSEGSYELQPAVPLSHRTSTKYISDGNAEEDASDKIAYGTLVEEEKSEHPFTSTEETQEALSKWYHERLSTAIDYKEIDNSELASYFITLKLIIKLIDTSPEAATTAVKRGIARANVLYDIDRTHAKDNLRKSGNRLISSHEYLKGATAALDLLTMASVVFNGKHFRPLLGVEITTITRKLTWILEQNTELMRDYDLAMAIRCHTLMIKHNQTPERQIRSLRIYMGEVLKRDFSKINLHVVLNFAPSLRALASARRFPEARKIRENFVKRFSEHEQMEMMSDVEFSRFITLVVSKPEMNSSIVKLYLTRALEIEIPRKIRPSGSLCEFFRCIGYRRRKLAIIATRYLAKLSAQRPTDFVDMGRILLFASMHEFFQRGHREYDNIAEYIEMSLTHDNTFKLLNTITPFRDGVIAAFGHEKWVISSMKRRNARVSGVVKSLRYLFSATIPRMPPTEKDTSDEHSDKYSANHSLERQYYNQDIQDGIWLHKYTDGIKRYGDVIDAFVFNIHRFVSIQISKVNNLEINIRTRRFIKKVLIRTVERTLDNIPRLAIPKLLQTTRTMISSMVDMTFSTAMIVDFYGKSPALFNEAVSRHGINMDSGNSSIPREVKDLILSGTNLRGKYTIRQILKIIGLMNRHDFAASDKDWEAILSAIRYRALNEDPIAPGRYAGLLCTILTGVANGVPQATTAILRMIEWMGSCPPDEKHVFSIHHGRAIFDVLNEGKEVSQEAMIILASHISHSIDKQKTFSHIEMKYFLHVSSRVSEAHKIMHDCSIRNYRKEPGVWVNIRVFKKKRKRYENKSKSKKEETHLIEKNV